MAFRRKSESERSLGECHNKSIPRAPPRDVLDPADLRDTALISHMHAVWEGCGPEIDAVR